MWVLTAKKLLPVKQSLAAKSIQYLWNSYKISQQELGARESLTKQLNDSKREIEQLPAHKIFVSAFEKIKKAQQGETVSISSIEEAKEMIKQGGMADVAKHLSIHDAPAGRMIAQAAPQEFLECVRYRAFKW